MSGNRVVYTCGGMRVSGLPVREDQVQLFPIGEDGRLKVEGAGRVPVVGDLASSAVASGAGGTILTGGPNYVMMEDGWHSVGQMSITNGIEAADEYEVRSGDGSIVANWSSASSSTVTVEFQAVSSDVIELLAGLKRAHRAHPADMTCYNEDDGWSCTGCGAASMSREMWEEIGCADEM